jgi:hypothetical protein
MIEITTFRLRADVDETVFAEADGVLQTTVFYQCPGLMRRTTARSADGMWVAIATWTDEPSADATLGWATTSVGGAAAAMIDPTSVIINRFVSL